jgi:putative transposase
MIKYKPNPRLKDFDYCGCYRYFITICTNNKKNVFVRNDNLVNKIVEFLEQTGMKLFFTVWVYCFMPDHLHILVEGNNERSDLKKFVKDFKQRTSYWYKNEVSNTGNKLWQHGYYEHILRKEEDTDNIIKYILNNPVRKGLEMNALDYDYSGSLVIDVKEIVF